MATDNTLEVAMAVLAQTERTAEGVQLATTASSEILGNIETVEMHFFTPTSSQGRIWAQSGEFGNRAAAFTHDVEVVLTQRRVESVLGDVQLVEIEFDEEGQRLSAVPVGQPAVYWRQARRPAAMRDCLFFEASWDIEYDAYPRRRVVLLQPLALITDTGTREIGFVESTAPRFLDSDGEDHDPFSMVPRENALRRRIKNRFFAEMKNKISSFRKPVPNEMDSELPRPFTPYFYHVSTRTLDLVARTLPKRRQWFPLLRQPVTYNQAVRLKSDHVRPEIQRIVAEEGLNLVSLEFKHGYIELQVHYHEERSISHINVEADVWLTYALRFPEGSRGTLYTEAIQTYWRYSWKAHRCWPICDDVGRRAERNIEREIAARELLTFPFKDFSATAQRAASRVEPYGLLIMLEVL